MPEEGNDVLTLPDELGDNRYLEVARDDDGSVRLTPRSTARWVGEGAPIEDADAHPSLRGARDAITKLSPANVIALRRFLTPKLVVPYSIADKKVIRVQRGRDEAHRLMGIAVFVQGTDKLRIGQAVEVYVRDGDPGDMLRVKVRFA